MISTLFIPGKVPSLNDLLYAKTTTNKSGGGWLLNRNKKKQTFVWNGYNDIKKDWSSRVVAAVEKAGGLPPYNKAYFSYLVVEQNKKRDPSNICATAIKFIEDALIKCKVIINDGWTEVLGINVHWTLNKEVTQGIFLVISNDPIEFSNMWRLWEKESLTLRRKSCET